jgi:hypothetical protein
MFDPHDLDPSRDPEASDTFEWFLERVEIAGGADVLDLSTPVQARALYTAVCDLADELVPNSAPAPAPAPEPTIVHLLEVAERDPDGNPLESVDHGFYDWPFSALPRRGEQMVLAGRLWAVDRRVWFPDAGSVGMFVVDLGASDGALRGGNGTAPE